MWGGRKGGRQEDEWSNYSSEISAASSHEPFRHGHECTDVLCFIVFIVSLFAFGHVHSYAMREGHHRKLTRGIDVNGNICGYSPPVKDKGVLYFCPHGPFSADESDLWIRPDHGVCLESCPSGTQWQVVPSTVPACDIAEAYLTKTVADRACLPALPTVNMNAVDQIQNAVQGGWHHEVMIHLSREAGNWPVLLTVTLAAVVLGYLYLFLLRELAGIMIWISVVLIVLLLAGSGCWMFMNAEDAGKQLSLETGISAGDRPQQLAYGVAIALWAGAGIVFALVCCCAQQMQISIACVQVGTDVMWHMPMMLVAPMVKGVAKVAVFVFLMHGFIMLVTTGEVSGTTLDRQFTYTDEQKGFLVFYMFCSLWYLAFITAWYQFSVAYSVAKYYHTPPEVMDRQSRSYDDDDRRTGFCAVGEGAWIGLTKHSGSLAFGSAILALTQLIHILLEYAEKKNREGVNNPIVSCVLRCLMCIFGCCESLVQTVNKNAFINIAITSQNFCGAVYSVMKIFAQYGFAMAVLNGATIIFQVLGMLLITVSCGLFADYLFTTYEYEDSMSGVVLSCCIAAVVAWSFMTIFDTTTDTLLFCYALDDNRYGHTSTAPEDMRTLFSHVEYEQQHGEEEEHNRQRYKQ